MLSTVVSAEIQYPGVLENEDVLEGQLVVGSKGIGQDFVAAANMQEDLLRRSIATPAKKTDGPQNAYSVRGVYDFYEGGEALSNVRSTITSQEWTALAPSAIKTPKGIIAYDQYFYTQSGTKVRTTIATGVPDDDAEIPQTYLNFDSGIAAYEYKMVFREPLESDVDEDDAFTLKDLEGAGIQIMGRSYTIMETEHPAQDSLLIRLISDGAVLTLREGETKTVTIDGEDYTIEVMFVSNSQSGVQEVKLRVNGDELDAMGVGDNERLDGGLYLVVREVLVNAREGVVELSIGSGEVVISDTNISDTSYGGVEYVVADEDVEDTNVKIEGVDGGLVAGATVEIKSIAFKFTPQETHYVGVGKRLSQIVEDENQLFGKSFDISYDGGAMYAYAGAPDPVEMEGLQLTPEGDDSYILSFQNKLGHTLEIPMFYDDNGAFTRFGSSSETTILVEGVNITPDDYFVVTSDGYLNATRSTGYTHLLQYVDKDADENTIEFLDVATDTKFYLLYTDGATQGRFTLAGKEYLVTFTDADDGNILVDLNGEGTITTGAKTTFVTLYGMTVDYDTSGTYAYKRFTTYSNRKEESLIGSSLNTALYASVGAGIQAGYGLGANPVATMNSITEWHDAVRYTLKDDDDAIDVSTIERCLDGATPWQIEQAVSNVSWKAAVRDAFFNNVCYPTGTTTLKFAFDVGDTDDILATVGYGQKVMLTGDDGGPDSIAMLSSRVQAEHIVTLHALPLMAAEPKAITWKTDVQTVTDADVKRVNRNTIVFGGPCANSVAADLLDAEEDCAQGYEPGKGRLTLFERDGYNILVVSGYNPEDTMLAAQVLLKRGTIEGTDVSISGTVDAPVIEPYVAPAGAPQRAEEPVQPVEAPAVETAPATYSCDAGNDVTGTYDLELKKLGITKNLESHPRVVMDGLDGQIEYKVSEKFEAQLGVNWMQYIAHIRKDGCDGTEIGAYTFRWEDGDGDKRQRFTVPEEGCYCMTLTQDDVSIDSANIRLLTNDGLFTMEFSTRSPAAAGNGITGNAIFDGFPMEDPALLNDMDVWD